MKFDKVIGDLRYFLKPYEENAIKFKFANLMHSIDNAKKNNKNSDNSENETQTNIFDKKSINSKATSLNDELNKMTKKYLLENVKKEKKIDIENEKTVEDAYLDTQENITSIKWDENKEKVQKKQIENLKEILSEDDFNDLTNTIYDMNTNHLFLNMNIHQKILSILLKYNDIDAYLILNQLCGRFEILAYYEIENGTIVQKELKAISTKKLTQDEDKKYKKLVNMETLLLDVVYSKYFKGFFIFTDYEKGLLSYASDFQNNQRGYLGIDALDFSGGISNDFEKSRFYHSIINELSRVILLSNSQIDYTKADGISDIDDFEIIKNFSKKDSYLIQFYVRFWDDLLYEDSKISSAGDSENLRKYFYLRHNREFLNEYVSQDPFRDIIESMTIFILEKKPLEPEEKFQKIRFFYEFSELTDIKQRLSLNIKHLEEQ